MSKDDPTPVSPLKRDDEEKRTEQQNRALHKWFRSAAEAMREQGVDARKVMVVPVMPTERVVKEAVWKPIMFDMFGKESTTELLKKKEIDDILDVIIRTFGEMGYSLPPFPSEEEKFLEEEAAKRRK